MSSNDEKTIGDDSRTLKRADHAVNNGGFPLPNKPTGDPESLPWPNNVGDLTPAELAHHMTWWSGWTASIRYAVARAETNELAFSESRRLKVQVGIHRSEGDKKTVTELRASVEQGRDIQDLDARILLAKAEKKMLRALLAGYEEKYTCVSREISRRSREEWEGKRSQ